MEVPLQIVGELVLDFFGFVPWVLISAVFVVDLKCHGYRPIPAAEQKLHVVGFAVSNSVFRIAIDLSFQCYLCFHRSLHFFDIFSSYIVW